MMKMKAFVVCLLVLALVFLCFFYPKAKDFKEIIQVPINKLTDDLLFECQPIIISDNIVSLDQVINVCFAWGMYTSKHTPQIKCTKYAIKNKYKYLLCHNNNKESNNIILNNVEIILKPGNIIIIPFGLYYKCKNKMLKLIGLHNLSTFITL